MNNHAWAALSATALVAFSALGCTSAREMRARQQDASRATVEKDQSAAHASALLETLKRTYASAPPPVLPIVKVKLRRSGGRTVADVTFYKDRNEVPGSFVASTPNASSVIRISAGGFNEVIELDPDEIQLINDAADKTDVTVPGLPVPKISRYSRIFACSSIVHFDHDDSGVHFPEIRGALAYEHD